MIEYDEYFEAVQKVAHYPNTGERNVGALIYCALGLAGESGEVADKVKKILRDDHIGYDEKIPEDKRIEILKELGDVLWYVTRTAEELGSDLDEVARMNIDKLFSRRDRGVLGGSGDNR